jgi:predicted RNA-binding protein with PIN domain
VPEPTLYLFDGYNVLHAGSFRDVHDLIDSLASFVAMKGARGVVVFDGGGNETGHGPLEVRYAEHADAVIERLAAEHRGSERVCVVSSDAAIRGTSGQEVIKLSSQTFVGDLEPILHRENPPAGLGGRLDEETREQLERLRRGQGK